MKGNSRSKQGGFFVRRNGGFCKYLKPGALARLRDSKITAKSTQMALLELLLPTSLPNSPSSRSEENGPQIQIDGVPSFALKINSPCCLRRKKLFAVTPNFTEAE